MYPPQKRGRGGKNIGRCHLGGERHERGQFLKRENMYIKEKGDKKCKIKEYRYS
jgi:hypothetical protein